MPPILPQPLSAAYEILKGHELSFVLPVILRDFFPKKHPE